MKGVRFYLEFNSASERRKKQHAGNVFAAFVCNGRNHVGGYDGIGSVYDQPYPTANGPSAPQLESLSITFTERDSRPWRAITAAEPSRIEWRKPRRA